MYHVVTCAWPGFGSEQEAVNLDFFAPFPPQTIDPQSPAASFACSFSFPSSRLFQINAVSPVRFLSFAPRSTNGAGIVHRLSKVVMTSTCMYRVYY